MRLDREKLDRIIALAQTYGATRLILFGSAVSTPDTARDIDLACAGIPGWKLFELAAQLEDELKTPLDIVPLNPPTRFTRRIEERGKVLL